MTKVVASRLVCVAADFFPGGDRTSERKSGRAKEYAWVGENEVWPGVGKKIGEKWGGSEQERGGVGRKGIASPPASALYFSHSLPVSFPSRKFLETPATQATIRSHLEM